MDIQNSNTYYNAIYSAVVVNDLTEQDPEGLGRVQIYIPKIHFAYLNDYVDYMNSSDKSSSDLFKILPWAYSVVKDLKIGDEVFCGYIDNTSGKYLILGVNAAAENTDTSLINSDGTVNGSGVLNLAMPIILQNEVGISVSQWPDDIPDDNYIRINPADNGGWSIGLIQWHHARAFDVLNYIASKDNSWKNGIDMSIQLFKDIESSLSKGTAQYRTKYQASFHPTKGTSVYSGIQSMLGSEVGKSAQKEYATKDTQNALSILQSDPYNIQNPAVLIYLLDIMNQYGNGITSKKKAAEICKNNSNIMSALEEFRKYWKVASLGLYTSRRDRTYAYICNLEKQGKLTSDNLVDLAGANQGGKFLWPCPDKPNATITSKFGWRGPISGTSYNSDNYHKGIDLGVAVGTKLIAVGSGTIIYAYNDNAYHGGAGNCVAIQHSDNIVTKYFHQSKVVAKTGATVQAGELIGYSGNTGNSSGPHLHFQLEVGGNPVDPLPYIKKS